MATLPPNITDSKGNVIDIHKIIDREEKKYDAEMYERMISGNTSPMMNKFKKANPA